MTEYWVYIKHEICLINLRRIIIITGTIAAWNDAKMKSNRIPKINIRKSKAIKNLNLPIFIRKFWKNMVIDWLKVDISIMKIANSLYSYSDNFK